MSQMTYTQEEKLFMETSVSCGGMEVHRDDWPIAEKVVKYEKGWTLGPARGPDKAWRRLIPPDGVQ